MASYLNTDDGYNMFDMLSMMQKAIRRQKYEYAAFAANQLKNKFRKIMWNRLLVISSEDCFGVITKEIVNLRCLDDSKKNDDYIADAVALLCINLKSRDACYYACNFVLAVRNPRQVEIDEDEYNQFEARMKKNSNEFKEAGFEQLSLFGEIENHKTNDSDILLNRGYRLQKAIAHKDMDMSGYYLNLIKDTDRSFLWDVLEDFAELNKGAANEINALRMADGYVNGNKKEKDEIFVSKAVMVLMYSLDGLKLEGSEMVLLDRCIDWTSKKAKDIRKQNPDNLIPEWVYDCHTIRGKKMGKTDWDMTRTEQIALTPLRKCYFDEASWIYTYEDDYQNRRISDELMKPIREYAEEHEANPVAFIPYE